MILKRIVIFLFLSLTCHYCWSQDSLKRVSIADKLSAADSLKKAKLPAFPARYYVGFSAGVNLCRINFDVRIPQETLIRQYYGISFENRTSDRMGVWAGFAYAGKGWSEVWPNGERYKKQTDYFELIFLTSISLSKRAFRPSIDLGPYLGWLNSEEFSGQDYLGLAPYHFIKLENKLDFGLAGGITFHYDTSWGGASAQARLIHGLSSVFVADIDRVFGFSQNQVIRLGASIMYRLK